MRTANKSIIAALFFLALFVCLSAGCERQHSHNVTTAWAHAGQASERAVLQRQIAQFNRQHYKHPIALTFIPERQYNAQVQAAALAGDLPDVLEFDGPYLYNYIWQQQLRPLDKLLPRKLIDDLLPSIIKQGTYGHHLYSIGVYDSGLGLYARKSALQKIHARIPRSAADAWSVAEFDQILAELAKRDPDRAVLDLKLNYTGEWYTYAFSPVIESAGGDLIDRRTYQTSNGFINSPAAVAALQQVQHWIQRGWVDPNLDDAAFVSGRVALSWSGHWEYARYKRAWGNDLLVLPLPNFGQGSKTGQGSWNWGITAGAKHPHVAADFLRFLLQPDQVLAMCDANGAVPGTHTALRRSRLYGKHGDLHLFAEQLVAGVAVPRPRTPAYPVITRAFQQAFQQIRNGANVKAALDVAAQRIDQDIRDNQGYPFVAE